MEDFLQAIGEVLSFVLFGLAIALYITYQSELSSLMYVGVIGILSLSIVMGFGKSYARYHHQIKKAEGENEEPNKLIDLSPAAELYYDLVTWVCVAGILGLAAFSEQGVTGFDIAQAVVAYVCFMVGRKFLIREAS